MISISSLGLLMDAVGFTVLFLNGGFSRGFNSLDGLEIFTGKSGEDVGMRAVESKKTARIKLIDKLAFLLVVTGFVLQFLGSIGLGW